MTTKKKKHKLKKHVQLREVINGYTVDVDMEGEDEWGYEHHTHVFTNAKDAVDFIEKYLG